MRCMKVKDAMSRDVRVMRPAETLYDAARAMEAMDIGALPVADQDRLIGIVTDRDLVVRALARCKGPTTRIREVMSAEVRYCYEDEDLAHVAATMAQLRVRRLPVVDRDKRLVGILSLSDIALVEGREAAGEAISGVSRPGGPHSQTTRA